MPKVRDRRAERPSFRGPSGCMGLGRRASARSATWCRFVCGSWPSGPSDGPSCRWTWISSRRAMGVRV